MFSQRCSEKGASRKANKAQNNKQKQKKKRKAKKATEQSEKKEEQAEESDSDVSEAESPKKIPNRIRLAGAEMDFPKKNLSERINDKNKDERKKFDEEIAGAFCRRNKVAKN